MFVPIRLALTTVSALLTPATCHAMDDYLRAASAAPTAITLCGETNRNGNRIKAATCKDKGYDKLIAAIDTAFDAVIAKTPLNIRPLLKRDEAWFNEMIGLAADTVQEVDEPELSDKFVDTLRRRKAALDELAGGFGRSGLSGTWANAFGSLTVSADTNGARRVTVDMSAYYGSDKHRQCKLSTTVTKAGSWLSGSIQPPPNAAPPAGEQRTKPAKLATIKLRRQGETLRVVMVDDDDTIGDRDDCDDASQITGTYFPSSSSDGADKAETSFVAPTFDCTRPETATDEEICSDPDLAENDQRLNRAWKALLPRLDDPTRRALTEDQRNWVRTQTEEFPEFLHPAWNKRTSEMHFTADARGHVDALQRERIALLEGFDDKRAGLAGLWLAYNAILKVTIDKDGTLTAQGWKWEQGDWKAGCEYEMTGKMVGDTFRANEQGKNPDTLERDHAMLIVNRLDDVFAKKRYGKDSDDEAKCRRRLDNSSTARLFPVRASPDIDNFSGSIR